MLSGYISVYHELSTTGLLHRTFDNNRTGFASFYKCSNCLRRICTVSSSWDTRRTVCLPTILLVVGLTVIQYTPASTIDDSQGRTRKNEPYNGNVVRYSILSFHEAILEKGCALWVTVRFVVKENLIEDFLPVEKRVQITNFAEFV